VVIPGVGFVGTVGEGDQFGKRRNQVGKKRITDGKVVSAVYFR
jgi:hypothetical protein